MHGALIVIFVLAYAAIALEHPIKINKSASALLGAGLLWTVYAILSGDPALVAQQLNESLAATAQIVFFLMGAMTIVEVIDAHNGFEVITSRIRTTRLSGLMWLVGFVTFFLSAVLDNLTTTIVMISLMKKLLDKHDDRLFFAAMIVIAANAGGAWTPIGDVTTTMLWIGGQITTLAIMKGLLLPALANLVVPLLVVSYLLRGREIVSPGKHEGSVLLQSSSHERNLMFCMGLGVLVMVPAFKSLTHLPPFMGILFGLGILWLAGELIHRGKEDEEKEHLTLVHALKRIDMSSIVFFIGILLAVATLEHSHILAALARWLDRIVGRQDVIVTIIGLVSAIVDNVPLVAASMGMYNLAEHPADSFLWEFIAYCAGTGGSILIIGSAAGVAAMGLEKIHFFWYVKRISGLALLGYFAGVAAYIVQYRDYFTSDHSMVARSGSMSITIYGIRNCDAMKKARQWLDTHGVAYDFHDYKTAGLEKARLERWCKVLGWEALLNRAGTTFRKLPDSDKQALDARRAVSLMLAQPSLVKRPVLEIGSRLLVGFKPEIYERAVRP